MNATVTGYVDMALAFATRYAAYLMYEDAPVPVKMAVPPNMSLINAQPLRLMMEHPESDGLLLERMQPGQYPWQAVESTVTDADIECIEQRYSIRFPNSYKDYLKYKHHYSIYFQPDIRLYPQPVGSWKDILCDNNDEMREDLLERGYFAIGDYSDYGVICLAINDGDDEDCRVVMIDFECGAPEDPEDEEVLGDSFTGFLEGVMQQGAAGVRELKDWEQRMYDK